jgi:hypothetical protein
VMRPDPASPLPHGGTPEATIATFDELGLQ